MEFGVHIDYEKLSRELSQGKELLRTYYYNCLPYQCNPPSSAEREKFAKAQRFYRMLTRLPKHEVRQGKLAKRGESFEQKGVDTLLSIDLVNSAASGKIEDAVLLAGDSDYIPAVRVAKEHSINVTLYHSHNHRSYHTALWEICDIRHPIDSDLIERIKRIQPSR